MKAKNTTSKISKIYNQEITTEDNINKFNIDSTIKKKSVLNTEYVFNLNNKIHDFSTEWMDLDTYIIETMPPGTGGDSPNIYFMHQEFRITLVDIPIKYLPFININIMYKYEDLEFYSLEIKNVRKSYFFQVSDIVNDIAKNVELVVGVGIDGYYPVSAKVLIKILNSEFYL